MFGGAIRLLNLLRAFGELSTVDLVTLESWTQDPVETRAQLGELADEVRFVPNPPPSITAKVRAIATGTSLDRLRYQSSRMQPAIDEMGRGHDYDVVLAELTPMAAYDFSALDGVKILDLQNIEHELGRRRASLAGRGPRRFALELDWRATMREEIQACRDFDLVFTPSDRESRILEETIPGQRFVTVANTIAPDTIPFRPAPSPGHELLFVGATHVHANHDAVTWFANEVFPLVRAQLDDVSIKIVGGDPPPEVRDLGTRPGIEVTGFVDDLEPLYASAAAQVIPLRTGGGTRLKLLESLSAGLPTVTTSIGAEGIEVADRTHVLIADEPADFADRTVELLTDDALRLSLAHTGRELVESSYSWRRLVPVIRDTLA